MNGRRPDPPMPNLTPGISVVVPVYNSEETLPALVARLEPVLRAAAEHFEVILVNDASRDNSWNAISQIVETVPWVRGINLMRNYGQHNALLCGIRTARFDTTITIDDDLQNPPEEIPKLLAPIKEEMFDIVYGKPRAEQHGLWRDLASVVTKFALQAAMGAETACNVSAFRALRTKVREGFADFQGPFVSIDVLLTWATTKFTAVKVRHEPRASGASNYTFRKLAIHALNMMTGFSTMPLRAGSIVGFSFTFFGSKSLINF